jgi:hypothetical protein
LARAQGLGTHVIPAVAPLSMQGDPSPPHLRQAAGRIARHGLARAYAFAANAA